LLPLEDALGIEQQANLPGTIDTHPNWSRRLPGTAKRCSITPTPPDAWNCSPARDSRRRA
jgi:4-alpha-glucanotransferase